MVVSYCKTLSLSSVQNSCRIGQWLYDPLELKKVAYNIFFELMVLLAIHGRFLSFHFHCLLSALLCGSNMCTQVSSPVSKLEITRLLQPLYVFKSSHVYVKQVTSTTKPFWPRAIISTNLEKTLLLKLGTKYQRSLPSSFQSRRF